MVALQKNCQKISTCWWLSARCFNVFGKVRS